MVYYLGRDVKVYITTESPECQVDVLNNAVSAISAGGSSIAATATFTFGDTEFDSSDEETITLIDAADLSKTYKIMTGYDATASSQEFNAGASATAAAANFKQIVESSDGHNGTITVAVSSGQVTMTQTTAGTAGNTTIAHSSGWDGICDVNVGAAFTGGVSDPTGTAGSNFAENLDATSAPAKVSDLTGVDLGIGVTDEDVTYMGKKTVLKAEIKKETTISLTRKKKNNVWDVVYNGPTATNEGWDGTAAEDGDYGARWGVIEGTEGDWHINNGLMAPKNAVDYGGSVPCFGYRVHIELKSGEEVISIPGCQLTGHTISLNADGTTEETCELISQVTPKIGTAINYDRLTAADM